MEVKPGYKQTEGGVIPEEWEIAPLRGKVCISHGYAFASQYFANHGPYLLATPGHFYESGGFRDVGDKQKHYVGPVPSDYVLQTGDVIVAMTEQADGLLGSAAVIPNDKGYLHNQRLGRVRVVSSQIDLGYLVNLFNSPAYRSKVRETAAGTKVKHTSPDKLLEIAVRLPPLPEQRAIAAALSDVDGLLGGLDRLIAKKRDLKQAAMQQLLTGQTRLPGFHGEWEVKRLGDVGKFLKGSGVKKDQTRSGSLACVRYGELYTLHNDVVREFQSWISPEVAATAVRLKQGDILFAGSGETKEEIGKCAAFVSDVEAYAGGDIVILRPDTCDSVYLGYYLNTGSIARQKASRGQGDAVVHISSSALSDVRCKLPPHPEQTAIAEVLSEMDGELAVLEQRREKTRALKQAMMQELLTGRTRLL
jgi:type I restriction enzyme S subunit